MTDSDSNKRLVTPDELVDVLTGSLDSPFRKFVVDAVEDARFSEFGSYKFQSAGDRPMILFNLVNGNKDDIAAGIEMKVTNLCIASREYQSQSVFDDALAKATIKSLSFPTIPPYIMERIRFEVPVAQGLGSGKRFWYNGMGKSDLLIVDAPTVYQVISILPKTFEKATEYMAKMALDG